MYEKNYYYAEKQLVRTPKHISGKVERRGREGRNGKLFFPEEPGDGVACGVIVRYGQWQVVLYPVPMLHI